MPPDLAEDLLGAFDVGEDSRDFLADVYFSPDAPAAETARLLHISLTTGHDDFCLRLQRATAARDKHLQNASPLEARDLLAFVSRSDQLDHASPPTPQPPWAETDRLLRELAESLQTSLPSPDPRVAPQEIKAEPKSRKTTSKSPRRARVFKSPFWAAVATHSDSLGTDLWAGEDHIGPQLIRPIKPAVDTLPAILAPTGSQHEEQARHTQADGAGEPPAKRTRHDTSSVLGQAVETLDNRLNEIHSVLVKPLLPPETALQLPAATAHPKPRSPVKSPFFAPPTPKTPPSKTKRPPAGTVSAIPFPPLDADYFSLVQEKLCHEPFWLLIAVTFLIKTTGKLAIPAFYAVKERFPTPAHLADPEAAPIIMEMIRHLGLCVNRTTSIQRYARGWVTSPPQAGVTFRVRGYDKRDTDYNMLGVDELDNSPSKRSDTDAKADAGDAWEIGHLTQGKYALDSWRIFCRDELLGRAQDWNGKGAAPEFQPECMRVRPGDKELRACLRWMWMKEGWEWDPETGERVPLRQEMAAAVNECRVEYDDTGGLRILDEPRTG